MRLKNLKITSQIILSFLVVAISFTIFGYIEYRHNVEVFENSEILYFHPLQVRKALDQLKLDVYETEIAAYNITLLDDEVLVQQQIAVMNNKLNDTDLQFQILGDYYLGPALDLENLLTAYINWETSIQNFKTLIDNDDIVAAQNTLLTNGSVEDRRVILEVKIGVVDDFAIAKADSLYEESLLTHNQLLNESLIYLTSIVLLTALIGYILIYQIERPIKTLTSTTKKFHEGDMSSRSFYTSKNEFGLLSDSINTLVSTIELNTKLSENIKEIADQMLQSETSSIFFHDTLETLMKHTNSNMGLVYLLNESTNKYICCDSIGIENLSPAEYSKDKLEGEIGLAVSTKNMQWIKDIPDDTFMTLSSGFGSMKPKDIITIPIISHNEVIVVICLASIFEYDKKVIEYLEQVKVNITSRVGNILNYEKASTFGDALEQKNTELEMQAKELTSMTNELIQQNRELDVQKQELTKANELKTIFLSNMSHELRTPLNSVIALSSVLIRRLSELIPNEEHSYLKIIENNGKHLLELINDILDISRIEAGKEEIYISKIDIGYLLFGVVEMLSPMIKEKPININLPDNKKPIVMESDEKKIRHIMHNIIGNALKFTEKGKIDIEFAEDENYVSIFIKDTGIGISDEALPHIFDEFKQADSSTSRRFGGTGLGLAIAQKYANLLGGFIDVISEEGVGSEFVIHLPKSSKDNASLVDTFILDSNKNKKTNRNLTIDTSAKTILLVDDSEAAIIQVEDLLNISGFKTLTASNAIDALNIIDKTKIDGIILDLMLPDLDGFETLKIIRNSKKTTSIPVLILSAKHITKEELRVLTQNNIHELVQKGDIDKEALLDSIYSMFIKKTTKSKKVSKVKVPRSKKTKILVVEDNIDNMTTVRALLKDKYEILEAVSGEEGIRMATKYVPDLILMDIALPGMTGIEAFKIIHALPNLKHIPVIAITASALASEREMILSSGFDAYIAKPIFEKDFYKTIEVTLNEN